MRRSQNGISNGKHGVNMTEDKLSVLVKDREILSMIHTFRGKQVMLDSDLADLYQVTTKRLNQQVSRNRERFPSQFMFQLSEDEFQILRSQIVTSSELTNMVAEDIYHMSLQNKVLRCFLQF